MTSSTSVSSADIVYSAFSTWSVMLLSQKPPASFLKFIAVAVQWHLHALGMHCRCIGRLCYSVSVLIEKVCLVVTSDRRGIFDDICAVMLRQVCGD